MRQSIAAGTTLQYTASLPNYPASAGWVLHYRMAPRGVAGAPVEFSAAASGDDHAVNVPHGTTAAWVPGAYTLAAWVERGAERFVVDEESGSVQVAPNPTALAAGADSRSAAEIALANVQALLTGKAASGVESYRINGRELRSYPLADLLKLEQKLKADVNAEHAAAGRPLPYSTGRVRRILCRIVA